MKKKFCLILAMICLLVTIPLPAMAADPIISVSSTEGNAGETVTVDLSIEWNPGLSYLSVKVGYDSEQLTLTGVENKNLIGGTFQEGPIANNPIVLLWANSSTVADGVLATLSFQIREDATLTTTPVTVTVMEAYDLTDNMNDVAFATYSGQVGIYVPTSGVELDRYYITLDLTGEGVTLIATVSPSNATNKNVVWSSNNPEVADVSDTGFVTAISKGTANIMVKTEDGDFAYECVVTVVCSHAGGSATCQVLAVCEVCGESYGDYGKHVLTKQDSVEPDHYNAGNIEYYTCDVCDKLFSDSEGTTEIVQEDTVLGVVPHSHATTWSTDSSYHWKECSCGDKAEYAEHVYDNTCDTTCNTCGYERMIEHTWNSNYSSDESSHWFECSVCGEKKNVSSHSCDSEIVGEKYLKSAATDNSSAVYYKSCTVCEGVGTDTFELSAQSGKISVSKVQGFVGKEVAVTISIDENPGLVNMLLSVKYDKTSLKLKSVTDAGIMGEIMHSDDLETVPYTLCWANDTLTENITATGSVVTLTFEVLEGATLGESAIEVFYDYGNAEILDFNFNLIGFEITNGSVNIMDVLIGDVNGDGKINTIDRMFLARYIAKWNGYTSENVDLDAADVNGDGRVNTVDRMILARYIAKWSGYTELPYGD